MKKLSNIGGSNMSDEVFEKYFKNAPVIDVLAIEKKEKEEFMKERAIRYFELDATWIESHGRAFRVLVEWYTKDADEAKAKIDEEYAQMEKSYK